VSYGPIGATEAPNDLSRTRRKKGGVADIIKKKQSVCDGGKNRHRSLTEESTARRQSRGRHIPTLGRKKMGGGEFAG